VTLDSLQTLSLATNKVRWLPKEIIEMRSLQNLDLYWNDLQAISHGVFFVVRSLNVANNDTLLCSFRPPPTLSPSALSPSPSATAVAASNAVARSWQLESLMMASIRIDHFPELLRSLATLHTLDLHDNAIASLPDDLGTLLPLLRSLNVADNRLRRLPSRMPPLLELLCASSNRLDCLPPSLSTECSRLRRVQLDDNQIGAVDERLVVANVALELIELRRNRLVRVPPLWLELQQRALAEAALRPVPLTLATSVPNEIVPLLYLGSVESFQDGAILREHSIGAVVRVMRQPLPLSVRSMPLQFLCIAVQDSAHENLAQHFERAYEFIDDCIERRRCAVLVHCSAGISRSPTIVASYLMRKFDLTLQAALHLMRTKRPICQPNAGFMRQLADYERRLSSSVGNTL
jgi:Leucine-rich repeat (LRR) protein